LVGVKETSKVGQAKTNGKKSLLDPGRQIPCIGILKKNKKKRGGNRKEKKEKKNLSKTALLEKQTGKGERRKPDCVQGRKNHTPQSVGRRCVEKIH